MKNNLAKIRGKHQLTMTKVAEDLGITKQAVSLNENKKVSISMAKKMADYFNENIFEILGSDALVILPKTEEDKQIIIEMIKGL